MAFYKHIGDPPGPEYTIDRIDNDKGYEPGNVRWATYSEQNYNRRGWAKKGRGRTKRTIMNAAPAADFYFTFPEPEAGTQRELQ